MGLVAAPWQPTAPWQTTNLLLLMMQLLAAVITHVLLPAPVSTGMELAPSYLLFYPGGDAHDRRLLSAVNA